jgi:hypothetical protein
MQPTPAAIAELDVTLVLLSGTTASTKLSPVNAEKNINHHAIRPPPELNRQGLPPPLLLEKIPKDAPKEMNSRSITSLALHNEAKKPVTSPAMKPKVSCPSQHTVDTEVLLEL